MTLRLAYVNVKDKPLVLFTAEIHQMGVPIEYVVNLPHHWPLKQAYLVNGSALSFPIDVLQRVAVIAAAGEPLCEGAILLREDPQFVDFGWPQGLCALIVVNHDWEAASAKGSKARKTINADKSESANIQLQSDVAEPSDDEVSILTLAPVFDGEKIPVGPALSKWIEKKRTAAWTKLCLPLRKE